MYQRNITSKILKALADTPVVFIRGARQTGKSTLVQKIAHDHYAAHYVSLDNAAALSSALSDPAGFLSGFAKPVIIDEVQRSPELLLAIKEDVDRNRTPGRYLLTGSANVLALPRVADALTGRVEILTLWPLSQGEIAGKKETFLNAAFSPGFEQKYRPPVNTAQELSSALVAGGYPEPLQRSDSERRAAWFDSYVMTLIDRDMKDLSHLHDVSSVPRLLRLLAARAGTLFNQSELSRSTGIANSTLSRYILMLETLFLVHMRPAWSVNIGKRVVKSPKIFFIDTGLACHLTAINHSRLADDRGAAGSLLENFVVSELLKQASWSLLPVDLYHFRSQTGQEVDIIIEDNAGRIVGIEVKCSATPTPKHFNGLKLLQDSLGDRFIRGILLYNGPDCIPFGSKLCALPVNSLWHEWSI